jgi:transcriptional regulator with XRE-family HTH domain
MTLTPDPEPIAFGQRMQILRERRGMSRPVLAGLVDRSPSWVKQVETGRLGVPKLPMILRIGEVLRVRNLADLTGDQSMSIEMFIGPRHARLPGVRDALNALPADDIEAPPVEHLRARLAQAWRARHAAPNHREVVGGLLPDMIRDAQLAVRQADRAAARRTAQSVACEVFGLTQFFLAYQPDSALLWRAAERCLIAAQEADDARSIGVAAWLMAQAHRDAGHVDAAEVVVRDACRRVEPRLPDADDSMMAIVGALYAEAGHTAARRGDQGTAWRHWDLARTAADRLPEHHYDPITSFSRAIIGAHAVTIAVELRAGGEGVRQADEAQVSVPSRPRRARHQIEEARAYQLARQPDAALAALAHAYTTAPETIRYNGYARRIVLEETEARSPRRRRRAAELATRIGILAA